ncbi:RICIN domain-containing protein [Catenulispora rubra]|uniref:RICIN domain-containing protein n=1 Tax=Catenulispora rubra TaxID=280293 RepID=UPI0018924D48|nr:RICIN domain-containing protein [Catenulispora rubra]
MMMKRLGRLLGGRRRLPVLAAVVGLALSATSPASASTTTFTLVNAQTGYCADLPGAYAPTLNDQLQQHDCIWGSGDNQMWYLQQVGTAANGTIPLYWIRNTLSTPPAGGNLCLDLPGYGSDPAGTSVYTYNCTTPAGNDNQEWEVLPVITSGGTYLGSEIRNYSDGLCLDVAGWASDGSDQVDDAKLTVYTCSNQAWADHGFDDHLWYMQPSPGNAYIPSYAGQIIVN